MTRRGLTKPSMIQRWREFGRRVNVRYLDAWTMGCTFVHGRVVFPFFSSFLVHRAHVGAGACLPLSQVEDNALYSVDERLSGQTGKPSRRKRDARSGLAPADTLGLCTASGSSGYEWATAWVPTLAC